MVTDKYVDFVSKVSKAAQEYSKAVEQAADNYTEKVKKLEKEFNDSEKVSLKNKTLFTETICSYCELNGIHCKISHRDGSQTVIYYNDKNDCPICVNCCNARTVIDWYVLGDWSSALDSTLTYIRDYVIPNKD